MQLVPKAIDSYCKEYSEEYSSSYSGCIFPISLFPSYPCFYSDLLHFANSYTFHLWHAVEQLFY